MPSYDYITLFVAKVLLSIRTRVVVSLAAGSMAFIQTWPKRFRVRRHFDEGSCKVPSYALPLWIMARNPECWFVLCCYHGHVFEQTVQLPVIRDAMTHVAIKMSALCVFRRCAYQQLDGGSSNGGWENQIHQEGKIATSICGDAGVYFIINSIVIKIRRNIRIVEIQIVAIGMLQNTSLQWRHNDRNGVSNHQPHECLLNRLFRPRSQKASKLRVTGLCAGNSPVNSPHKGPVTRRMFPFDDVIMYTYHNSTTTVVGVRNLVVIVLWECVWELNENFIKFNFYDGNLLVKWAPRSWQ